MLWVWVIVAIVSTLVWGVYIMIWQYDANNRSNKDMRKIVRIVGVVTMALWLIVAVWALAPSTALAQTQSGIASVYTTRTGVMTASGRRLNDGALTAAHKTLPFGTKVRVTNRRNGRSVVVTITDRGPFIRGRVIDLTMAGANAIGMGYGIAQVILERVR